MIRPVFNRAPSILSRDIVTNSLSTGWTIIDCLFPLGRGQRQLILGDKDTGKETIIRGIIGNQKRSNRWNSPDGRGRKRLFCFYACLGMRGVDTQYLEKFFKQCGSMWYTHILGTRPSEPAALVYVTAYEACAVAECFRDIGFHALLILDNMNNHAKAYRQMSLLVKNPPGREAYPGDVFFQHSRLLERAAQMSRQYGYGTLSAFPIYETQLENIRTYICTNLISITDGQIYLSKHLFKSGFKPAVDIHKSVSRVGVKAQSELLTWASSELPNILLGYFNTEQRLKMGFRLTRHQEIAHNKAKSAKGVWIQGTETLTSFEEQVLVNLALSCGHLCCVFPITSVRYLLKFFTKFENVHFSLLLLWLQNIVLTERWKKLVLDTYYFMQRKMPILLKGGVKSNGIKPISKTSIYLKTKFGNDGRIAVVNHLLYKIQPWIIKKRYLDVVGYVFAATMYTVTVKNLQNATYGSILEVRPHGTLGLSMRLDSKYIYAALLHKGNKIKPGHLVILRDLTLTVDRPTDVVGKVLSSRFARKS